MEFEKNPYDNIEPEVYQNRKYKDRKQKYLFDHWETYTADLIAKYAKNSVVLDLGCGPGDRTFEMVKYAKQVLGIDSSKRMLDYAKKKHQEIRFIYADATNVPIDNNSIDAVFSFGLIEYIRNKEALVKEISRVLKPGGVGVISSTNIYSIPCFMIAIYYKIIGKKRICSEPSFGQMVKLFNQSGFKIIDYKMDDGLFWLPFNLDIFFGEKTYLAVEKFFTLFKRNPFSMVMVFIIKKL